MPPVACPEASCLPWTHCRPSHVYCNMNGLCCTASTASSAYRLSALAYCSYLPLGYHLRAQLQRSRCEVAYRYERTSKLSGSHLMVVSRIYREMSLPRVSGVAIMWNRHKYI